MRFKPTNCKRLQGAADARRRVRRRTFVLQVPDNKADAVPCERLQVSIFEDIFVEAPSASDGAWISPVFDDAAGSRL